MDLQMSMKIEGVTGTSISTEHKGWSEIHSWNVRRQNLLDR